MTVLRVGLVLSLVWLIALILSSLIVQQPLGPTVLLALGRALLDVLAVTAMVGAAGGMGTLIGPDLPRLSMLERLSMRLLIGLAVMSVGVLISGLIGVFPSGAIGWTISIALIALLHRSVGIWVRDMRQELCLVLAHRPAGYVLWLRRIVLALLVLAFVLAFAPPTKWDALTYHLAGPRKYLEMGRIASFPENHFLGFPQCVEMLYLWLMILARPQAAALMHWVFGLITLLLLMGLARRLNQPDAGWLAAILLLTGGSIWGAFSWPYNDLAVVAPITAALAILQAYSEVGQPHRDRCILWAGVFVGLAMSAKYTAASAAVGIAAVTIRLTWQEGALAALRRLTTMTTVALLVFSPWPIKNALLDGNPFSPFLWGTSGFDQLDQWYYLRPGTGLDPATLIVAPIQATVFGQEGHAPYGASISPLVVGLLPLVVLAWRRLPRVERKLVAALSVFASTVYMIWLAGTASSWFLVQIRLLLPIFPALALLGALSISMSERFTRLIDLVRIVRVALLLVSLIAVLWGIVEAARDGAGRVTLGLESEDDYLLRHLGLHYAAMQQINKLPDDARVLTLWEPRSFYCPRRCIPDSMIDQWWHDRQIDRDPARIAERWRAQGISHVLIFESGWQFLVSEEPHEPLTQADMDALDELRQSEMIELWDGNSAYTLYELRNEGMP